MSFIIPVTVEIFIQFNKHPLFRKHYELLRFYGLLVNLKISYCYGELIKPFMMNLREKYLV
jgi:hypothetical protein